MPSRIPYRIVEWSSLKVILAIFAGVVLLCSVLYYAPWIEGASLVDSVHGERVTYLDSLYFSLVTVSSLGYGDLRPIGAGRLVASTQVLSGLLLVGLAIARLASGKQESIVTGLHAGAQRAMLQGFSERVNAEFDALMDASLPRDWERHAAAFWRLLHHVGTISSTIEAEIRRGGLAVDDPPAALQSLTHALARCAINVQGARLQMAEHEDSKKIGGVVVDMTLGALERLREAAATDDDRGYCTEEIERTRETLKEVQRITEEHAA